MEQCRSMTILLGETPVEAFLAEILSDLNQRNPQIAARLIEPLIRLKRYDAGRQALMRKALEQLKGLENLSGDLYEKISKALDA